MHKPLARSHWHIAVVSALLFVYAAPVLPSLAQDQCAPMINVDTPSSGAALTSPVTFSGWAVDENAMGGSGISAVQVVADGLLDAGGVLLGTAAPVARPDVDATLGMPSYGFTLTADLSSLGNGAHTFYVYAMTDCGPAYGAVSASLQPGLLSIDSPVPGATIHEGSMVDISGWTNGNRVDIYVDGPAGQTTSIASVPVDLPRPDVVQATGQANLANSGFDSLWPTSGLTTGDHTLYIYLLVNGNPDLVTVPVTDVAGAAVTTPNPAAIAMYGDCNPSYPAPNSAYPNNAPCGLNSTVYTGNGNCNPDFPNFNSNYPSNIPCSGANFANCNPFYPNENTLYPNDVPCAGTASYYTANCNPFYPTASTLYPNDIQCASTMAPGYSACNPMYPTAVPGYATNVPCSNGTLYGNTGGITCNPTYPVPNSSYPSNIPCPGNTTSNYSTLCSPSMGSTFGNMGSYLYSGPCIVTGLAGPSSVQAGQSAPGTATINWNAVNGATSYTVLRSVNGPSGPYTLVTTSTTSTSTIMSGLTPGTTYYFAVAANGVSGSSMPMPANPVTIID